MILLNPRPERDLELTDDSYGMYTSRSSKPTPGERLFTFVRQHDRFTCELRKVGRWGIEARFLRNQQFLYSRRHKTRELAIAWAEAERRALEGNPRYRDNLKPLGWPEKRPAR